jgi:hypothetical protein
MKIFGDPTHEGMTAIYTNLVHRTLNYVHPLHRWKRRQLCIMPVDVMQPRVICTRDLPQWLVIEVATAS